MAPCFHDATLMKNIDAIRRPHAREPVRNQQHGAVSGKLFHAGEYLVLGSRIEGSGGLVHDYERSASEEGSCERDPLPLADGEIYSASEHSAQQRVIAFGKFGQKIGGLRLMRGANDCRPVIGFLDTAEGYVFVRREVVMDEVLEEDGNRRGT